MRYDSVIFDLDGTLLNTLGDLRNAVNHALSVMGAELRTTDEVRRFVGNGVGKLIERAMPEGSSCEALDRALSEFRAYYNAHIDVETHPYPGVVELLEALRKTGVKAYVNSNKYDSAVKALCRKHFGSLVVEAIGESPSVPKKPSPAGVNILIELSGTDASRTLYVGDSSVDIETAANAGIDAAWVSWGFRTRDEMAGSIPDHAFDSAEELLKFIIE